MRIFGQYYLLTFHFGKMYMAGTLWKWTNYFNGWQERWFVLDNGNLSYYKSQDDVNTGCKGSVKMSVCDIVVHTTDPVRLDLIIPGEQHFYVRALNPKERQQWLVALGTSKASMGKLHVEPENASNDMLKTKRSELRLYCDLLMQQIHSVKMTVQETDIPDVEKLNQASSLISPTCDTFIRTLEECMKIVQTSMPFEGQHPVITDAALPTSPQKSNKKSRHAHRQNSYERSLSHQHSRSPSVSSLDTNPPSRQNSKTKTMPDTSISDLSLSEHKVQEHSLLVESMRTTNVIGTSKQNVSIGNVKSDLMDLEQKHGHRISCSSETGAMLNSNSAHIENFNNSCRTSHSSLNIENTGYKINSTQLLKTSSDEKLQCDGDVFLDPIEPRVPTFFSEMNPSFMDLKIQEDAGIAVEPFLDACRCLVPIFDKLSSTAFAPVKMDFQGNIRKVKTKYSLHPEQFKTLQSIILHEKGAKQHHLTNSATMALLWLKRSLEFISGFMEEIRKGEDNLGVAASNAYLHSLKPYHGWVVRGVFAVAVKALPYRDVFMTLLNPNAEGNLDEQLFQTCVLQDLESFNIALEVVIKILSDFYKQHDLDSDEQI